MGDAAFSAWRDKGQEQRTLSFLDVKKEKSVISEHGHRDLWVGVDF